MNSSLANINTTADYSEYNITQDLFEYQNEFTYSERIQLSVILIICCIGLPENGIVIWLLGFQIKRNSFTVLILNLAIADFGFLISMAIYYANILRDFIPPGIPGLILMFFFYTTYIDGLFLVTAISIDRCVSVLFPIWHRCSRPRSLSAAVCALLWIISFLLGVIRNIIEHEVDDDGILYLNILSATMLCFPLILTSAVILFIKISLKPKQKKRGRLLVMILITLLCFLILTIPLYFIVVIANFLDLTYFSEFPELGYYFDLCACLNSSVNPVIYFLVGRKKQCHSKESLKVIFQRVFKEDETPGSRQ